jgi:hypothetical protein
MAAEKCSHTRRAVFCSAWSCSRVEAAEGLHPRGPCGASCQVPGRCPGPRA